MDLIALILLVLVLVSVVLFITQPFFEAGRIAAKASPRVPALLAEREMILTALQELDFDNELKKFPADEYRAQRERLVIRGMNILSQLDQAEAEQHPSVEQPVSSEVGRKNTTTLSSEEIEQLISKRRLAQKKRSAGFCPHCGGPLEMTDSFCPACGGMVVQGGSMSRKKGSS
jgi:hypothetical protein